MRGYSLFICVLSAAYDMFRPPLQVVRKKCK
jgi:hypothetical protein